MSWTGSFKTVSGNRTRPELHRTVGVCLTAALFDDAAGVVKQLESLLEASCMLGGSIRDLNVGDEGAHLPLSLTGGWRQQTLIALVQRTGANGFCHRQDGDLGGKQNWN